MYLFVLNKFNKIAIEWNECNYFKILLLINKLCIRVYCCLTIIKLFLFYY